MPSRVWGPVLNLPCSLHRPLGMAGHWQVATLRFLAPQRGAFEESPEGLRFRSVPSRFSWGLLLVFGVIPLVAVWVRVSARVTFSSDL